MDALLDTLLSEGLPRFLFLKLFGGLGGLVLGLLLVLLPFAILVGLLFDRL
jgi:hypothetical protein